MKPPDLDQTILAIDGLDVNVYDSIEQMCADIEPQFILNGDYSLYAANGSPIRFHGTVSGCGRFERMPPTPESRGALRSSLLAHLTAQKHLRADERQALEELIRALNSPS